MPAPTTPVTTLLLDADGVVQHNPRLIANLTRMLDGHASIEELLTAEQRAIVGTEDLHDVLAEFVAAHGIEHDAGEFVEVWRDTEPDDEALALVRRVRAAGTPVYLATNQQPVRGQWMLDTLGYQDIFDGIFASFRMGVAKPDPAYFHHIVDDLGIDPAATLFIDDVPENVEGARSAGLQAAWHDRTTDAQDIARILREHGVRF